ncbi:MAG: phytanoyl-CoA dioxygenase family protein [Gammaproteobacteria bacterium]
MSARPEPTEAPFRTDFDRDGIAIVRGCLGGEWLDRLAGAAERIKDRVLAGDSSCGVATPDGTVYTENAWTFEDTVRQFVFESGIASIAAQAMQSREVRLFETLTIYKQVGCDAGTGWHQDLPQHGMVGDQACSIWLSLEPVDADSGGLRIAAGSHRGPWYTPMTLNPRRAHGKVELEGGPLPDPDTDPVRFPRIVGYAAQPGDILLLHPAVLHMTRPNPLRARRRSFSIRFFGERMRRKASPVEWHDWLQDLPLQDGDPMVADRLPRVWPAA